MVAVTIFVNTYLNTLNSNQKINNLRTTFYIASNNLELAIKHYLLGAQKWQIKRNLEGNRRGRKRREMWSLDYFPSLLSARIRNHLPTLCQSPLLLFRTWVWTYQSFRKPWHWKKAVCLQFTNKIISIQFLTVTSHSGCLWVWNLRARNPT